MSRGGRRPRGLDLPPVDHGPQMIGLWQHALESPRGIKIRTNRAQTLRTFLNKARRELSSGQYAKLRVAIDDEFVWIVPRDL